MQHNAEQERGLHSYRLGINEYSDLVSVPNANIEMLECPVFTNFNNSRLKNTIYDKNVQIVYCWVYHCIDD